MASRKIVINISGQQFVTTSATLSKLPETKLGRLADTEDSVFFFESDADIFKEILKFYWSGELHCPRSVCFDDFKHQLKFWEIDLSCMSQCCAGDMNEENSLQKQFDIFDRPIFVQNVREPSCLQKLRLDVWYLLTEPGQPQTRWNLASKMWAVLYLLITVYSGLLHSVGSVEIQKTDENTNNNRTACENFLHHMAPEDSTSFLYFYAIQIEVLAVFFAAEIIIRFICCPNKKRFWFSVNAFDMLISIFELFAIIFMEVLVLYHRVTHNQATPVCRGAIALEHVIIILSCFRLFRLISYASFYSELKVVLITIYRSSKEIILLLVLILMAMIILAPIVFYAGFGSRDMTLSSSISSIPRAYWFVLVTMTTVGYGDTYPTQFGGYVCTGFIMVIGFIVTALPIAIIGGNFAMVYKYNQKVKRNKSKANEEAKTFNDLPDHESTSGQTAMKEESIVLVNTTQKLS